MAIETYGLNTTTLMPYLTTLEGQVGAVSDAMSSADLTEIIETEAAKVGIAIAKALRSSSLTRAEAIAAVASDEYGARAARAVLISRVLIQVYQSVYQGSVLPEYLDGMRSQANRELEAITEDPSQLALSVRRSQTIYQTDAEAGVNTISSMFVGTDKTRLDSW